MACAFSFDPVETRPRDAWADGAILRDTTGALWVIYGGARFAIRDWKTFDALGLDPADIEPISLFALSQIGSLPAGGTVLRELSSSDVFVVAGRTLLPFSESTAQLAKNPWIAVVPNQSLAAVRAALSYLF
jgi:hypothetical protein